MARLKPVTHNPKLVIINRATVIKAKISVNPWLKKS